MIKPCSYTEVGLVQQCLVIALNFAQRLGMQYP